MNRVLLLVLCLSTLATCFVSRQRRVVNTDEDEPTTTAQTETRILCSNVTPCQWLQYDASTRKVIDNINNIYCECRPNTACTVAEHDEQSAVFVLRCQPLQGNNNATTTSVPKDQQSV